MLQQQIKQKKKKPQIEQQIIKGNAGSKLKNTYLYFQPREYRCWSCTT
jgi:hypothetical protein